MDLAGDPLGLIVGVPLSHDDRKVTCRVVGLEDGKSDDELRAEIARTAKQRTRRPFATRFLSEHMERKCQIRPKLWTGTRGRTLVDNDVRGGKDSTG